LTNQWRTSMSKQNESNEVATSVERTPAALDQTSTAQQAPVVLLGMDQLA